VDLQHYEDRTAIRIKFASEKGRRLVSDATGEYQDLFIGPAGQAAWLPPGWEVDPGGMIDTLTEHKRPAWRLRSADGEVVAVEHETGIEVLLAIGIGVSTQAVVGLTKALWKEWRQRRGGSRTLRQEGYGGAGDDALRVETTVEAPDGTRTQRTLSIPASLVDDKRIADLLGGAVNEVS
jgi:hypothetical protein